MSTSSLPSQMQQKGCLHTFFYIFCIIGVFLFIGEFGLNESNSNEKAVGLLAFLCTLLLLPIILLIKSKFLKEFSNRNKHAENLIKSDPRAPVIYLRSFDSDSYQSTPRTGGQILSMTNPYAFILNLIVIQPTFEQKITMIAAQVGPFIGFSKHGEYYTLGAARLNELSHNNWQMSVIRWINRSQIIILRLGDTSGLMWELTQIFEMGLARKLIIWLEFDGEQDNEINKARYNKFVKSLPFISKVSLPEFEKNKKFLFFNKKDQGELCKHMGYALKSYDKKVESNDFIAISKGWLPFGWNSPLFMWITQKWPESLAKCIGLILSLAVCATISRSSWYLITEYELGSGTIILLIGILISASQAILLPKILAIFKWRGSWLSLLTGGIFGLWALIWTIDGIFYRSGVGDVLRFPDFIISLLSNDADAMFMLIMIFICNIPWIYTFRIYVLSSYEINTYGLD